MKLAVCGDSWFCSDLKHPGASFGEILTSANQWELLSLARGGCSNIAISLQVDMAIALNADLVIVGTTSADRIEIPIQPTKLSSTFNWTGWETNVTRSFDKTKGLSNIQYAPHPDLSSLHTFLNDPTMISESMNNLAFKRANTEYYSLSDQQLEALKLYMIHLYDDRLKQQMDVWIINDACRRLTTANKPFILCTEGLYSGNYITDSNWLPDKNKVLVDDFSMYVYGNSKNKHRFHYNLADSKLIADYFNTRLEQIL